MVCVTPAEKQAVNPLINTLQVTWGKPYPLVKLSFIL